MSNFKKIFFVIILFFLAFSVRSYSEIVNKVDVKGNERISSETILVFGDVIIGNNYESSDVNLLENIKAYWRMNTGSGTTIYDYSGNSNHGSVQDPEWWQ